MPVKWEGAEIIVYYNGKNCSIDLSPTQFAVIAKILGLQLIGNEISYFADCVLNNRMPDKVKPEELKTVINILNSI